MTLGCKVNKYESDALIQNLNLRGFETTDKLEPADVFVINSITAFKEMQQEALKQGYEIFVDSSYIAPNYIYFFGHVHNNHSIMDGFPNCMCVSVERINYRPIDLDKYIRKLRKGKKDE